VGGMGVVLAATHLELDEPVALKVMLPKFASNVEAAERFAREARASVKIRSEHMVRVLDVARLEDGTPYMVMEYLEGSDLARLLETQGPLPPQVSVAYVLQACDAIAAAHALGIIHRDLKPGNLFLAQRGDGTRAIKVLDFGISKLSVRLSDRDATLTTTSATMGSPPYMAPEQMRSAKNVDARTDIWGLGCVLYELMVGRRPFQGTTMPELCAAIIAESPAPPSQLTPGIAQALDAVVLRCLEKLPGARYSSVAELASALVPFSPESGAVVSGILRRSAPSGIALDGSVPPPATRSDTTAAWGQTRDFAGRPGRQRWVPAAVTAIALGAAGLLGWWFARTPLQTSPPATAAGITGEAAQSSTKPLSAALVGGKSASAQEPTVRVTPAPPIAAEVAGVQREQPASGRTARPGTVRRAPPAGSRLDAGAADTTVAKSPAAEPAPATLPEPLPSTEPPKRRRTLDIGLK
jgi:eukaryotic-like serine/threonine-protein kinase